MTFGRSDVLTCPIDAPITIEDSECETETEYESELPSVEELFLKRPFSNQETGVTPVAKGMNTDPGT